MTNDETNLWYTVCRERGCFARKEDSEMSTDNTKYTERDGKKDFAFFKKNLKDLFAQYGNHYIVIRNQKVLGHYRTMDSAVKATTRQYPMGSFIIQKCGADESVYCESIHNYTVT
ncbi:MAG: hypothetical protein IJR00_01155 [Lachnospiraceae bacterium]|nr:hypothetical protein [Lachnospiraceae bacterium]